jgi:hypothetical protein
MRSLAVLFLLCACTSLSSDEQKRLADHQQWAAHYFEKGKWNQAMGQIERGLELEPDDYKLNSLKGGILLLASGDVHGTTHARLDAADALLGKLYEQRSPSRHEPHLLLNYALVQQKQGLRHLGEALRLEDQATRAATPDEGRQLREQATSERGRSAQRLQQADELLAELVSRGEMLRVALNHRLQIAMQRGDEKAFGEHLDAYLVQARKAQTLTRKRIDDAKNVDFERLQLDVRKSLVAEEVEVRALAAEHYYSRRAFNKALEHLNCVIEADPTRFVDYYNRGKVLLELGQREAADADFRRFLADPALPVTSEKAVYAMKVLGQ